MRSQYGLALDDKKANDEPGIHFPWVRSWVRMLRLTELPMERPAKLVLVIALAVLRSVLHCHAVEQINQPSNEAATVVFGDDENRPTPHRLLGTGQVSPGEAKLFPVQLLPVINEFILDVRSRTGTAVGLTAVLEIIGEDGRPSGIQPVECNVVAIQRRLGVRVRSSANASATVRISNRSLTTLTYWLYETAANAVISPPFFGHSIPLLRSAGKPISGTLGEGESAYVRTLVGKGTNSILADVRPAQSVLRSSGLFLLLQRTAAVIGVCLLLGGSLSLIFSKRFRKANPYRVRLGAAVSIALGLICLGYFIVFGRLQSPALSSPDEGASKELKASLALLDGHAVSPITDDSSVEQGETESRLGKRLRAPKPSYVTVRLENKGTVPLDYWLWKVGQKSKCPPFFGSVEPESLELGNMASLDLAPRTSKYLRVSLPVGAVALTLKAIQPKDGSLGGRLQFFSEDGSPIPAQQLMLEPTNPEYSAEVRYMVNEPTITTLQLTNLAGVSGRFGVRVFKLER